MMETQRYPFEKKTLASILDSILSRIHVVFVQKHLTNYNWTFWENVKEIIGVSNPR